MPSASAIPVRRCLIEDGALARCDSHPEGAEVSSGKHTPIKSRFREWGFEIHGTVHLQVSAAELCLDLPLKQVYGGQVRAEYEQRECPGPWLFL